MRDFKEEKEEDTEVVTSHTLLITAEKSLCCFIIDPTVLFLFPL
jgi:hypothetical protein